MWSFEAVTFSKLHKARSAQTWKGRINTFKQTLHFWGVFFKVLNAYRMISTSAVSSVSRSGCASGSLYITRRLQLRSKKRSCLLWCYVAKCSHRRERLSNDCYFVSQPNHWIPFKINVDFTQRCTVGTRKQNGVWTRAPVSQLWAVYFWNA